MNRPLIAVAMSGGVDSSVAAALLARSGERLVGFSMRLAEQVPGEPDRHGRCCTPDDCLDARRVAFLLDFPHRVLDMAEEFRRHVLEPFAEAYAAGRTPSPCIGCNTHIKFGALLDRAREAGADLVATGHYAALEHDPTSGRTLLKRGRDRDKDQSYFLFDLSEEQRRRARFPLGGLTKDEVRALAREMELPVASKAESMDLCFISAEEDYRGFLARRGALPGGEPGEIVDVSGRVLGRHAGIGGFTVGQRRGLGLAAGRPLFVVRIEPGTRRVVVGDGGDLSSDSCEIGNVRWVPFDRPSGPIRGTVKIRSTHEGVGATVTDHGDGGATVRFDEPQRAVAPGQAAVLYDGDLVLGGGWIRAAAAS